MLLKLAAISALGYVGYKAYEKSQQDANGVAFADGEPNGRVRNAGAAATASHDRMSKTDEALDETFPSSDATAKY